MQSNHDLSAGIFSTVDLPPISSEPITALSPTPGVVSETINVVVPPIVGLVRNPFISTADRNGPGRLVGLIGPNYHRLSISRLTSSNIPSDFIESDPFNLSPIIRQGLGSFTSLFIPSSRDMRLI